MTVTVLDSVFHTVDFGFQSLTGFWFLELDSGSHRLGFQIPQASIS